jgi:hypothetical protein
MNEPLHGEMDCPECAEPVEPMSGSTFILAWYECPDCRTFWSARLRNGKPEIEDAERPQPANAKN